MQNRSACRRRGGKINSPPVCFFIFFSGPDCVWPRVMWDGPEGSGPVRRSGLGPAQTEVN